MMPASLSWRALAAVATVAVAGCAGQREGTPTELDAARLAKAQADLKLILAAANLHRIKYLAVPTMRDLTTPDGQLPVKHAVDPWGHDYILRADDKGRPIVICVGPDGIESTGDDILPGN